MLNRNEKGKLAFKSLDFEIFIGDMFAKCKTEREIEWLEEQLNGTVECSSQERRDEIENLKEEI